jgi:alpha-beta hydrolase superfamily lysophospholipase
MYFPPELNGFKQQNLYFQSKDGTRLHAWYFEAVKPKGIVVQFHGNGQNMTAHYASLIWLVEQGYSLFTFDYRGYGESLGEPTAEGVNQDAVAALERAWQIHSATKEKPLFVIYGQSLGGVIAMRGLADFPHRDQVQLIVQDSTFMSYRDVAQQTLKKTWLTWPFSPLGRVLVSNRYSSKEEVKSLKARLLVIHDKKDPVVNFENGQAIFETATGPKDFWILNSGHHIATFNDNNSAYRVRFITLLDSLK